MRTELFKFPSLILIAGSCVVGVCANAAETEYKNLSLIVSDIQSLASDSGGNASAFKLTDSLNAEIQSQGTNPQPIWCLKIAKTGVSANRRILVTGTHHAREWVAYRAVLDAGQFIITNRNATNWTGLPDTNRFSEFTLFKEMNLKALTDNAQIFMVPIVNPEGYYFSKQVQQDPEGALSGAGWRKNRRNLLTVGSEDPQPSDPAEGSSTEPFIGVDLNRNYPSSDWGQTTYYPGHANDLAWQTTSRWRQKELYCGKPAGGAWTAAKNDPQPGGPLKEKETEAIVALSTANAFNCHIDVHAYGAEVGWVPDANDNEASPVLRGNGGLSDLSVLRILAAKAAEHITDPNDGNYLPTNAYATSGDTLVWQYNQRNRACLPFLIEIGKAGQFRPSNPTATAHADAVLPGQLFMMFAAVDKAFSSKPTARFRKP